MRKLLSLVLSVSILVSSITPALAQMGPVGRRGVGNFLRFGAAGSAGARSLAGQVSAQVTRQMAKNVLSSSNLQKLILAGNVKGLAGQILQKPTALRAPVLRNEFVTLSLVPSALTPAQRAQAVKAYQAQLEHTKEVLSKPTDANAFLKYAKDNPKAADVVAVQNVLADASALGLVGTKEDAPALLDFCEQAQGTQFDGIATLITAHGLLRMQAYEELQTVMTKYDEGAILGGVKDYIKGHKIPVKYEATTPTDAFVGVSEDESKEVADFLSRDSFGYNRLHADCTEEAVEKWVHLEKYIPASKQTPYEEPDLHESSVRPVYAVTEVPEKAQIGGDLVGADDSDVVTVGADGVKLTLEGEDKVEHILHNVDLTVSNTLKHFTPEYNRLALDTNHIFELRNQTEPTKRPDHFFFALSTENGELNTLLEGVRRLNLSRPMRIKIQRTGSPKETIALPVFDKSLQEPPVVVAEVDTSLLSSIKDPEKGHIWTYQGALYFRNPDGVVTQLEGAFVRLPKAESQYWTKIFKMYPQTSFKLGVFSTKEKMIPVTYLVPSLQVGLGKTMSPVLNDMSTLGETASSSIMFGINNVLPSLMGFLHPFLKQYGEAAVFRIGTAIFPAAGLVALATGLYGHIGGTLMSNWQLAGFLTSSVLIALGTNITRLLQNPLISANRGILPQDNSFQKKTAAVGLRVTPPTYNARFFLKRGYEVLTKKADKSLRDIVFFQRGAMFKNLGTMLFLSFPWLANMVGKAFGVDLGLDFSASYVPYSLFSLYTLRKVYQTRYKDAFPLNQTVLQNNLQDVGQAATFEIYNVAPAELTAEHPVIVQVAKKIKTAIDALTPVEARKTKTTINTLTAKHEKEAGEELENMLSLIPDRTPEQARAAREALQQAFDNLGHRNVKLKDVILMAGLPASLGAMTLATLGELGLSNGLAFAMRELIGNGTAATGLVGILLYGCMFGWRIVGNVLSQRMSGGSMYAVSSMASVVGPLIMALAGNSVGPLVTGAMIACFGISNFFSQMYEYMVGLHPKYKREIALLINYTMPAAAIPAALLRWAVKASGIPSLDIGIAGLALAASVALTPGMLANSSLVQGMKYGWQQLKTNVKRFFNRGGDAPTTGTSMGCGTPFCEVE